MKYQQFAPKMLNLDLIEKNSSKKIGLDCLICSHQNTQQYQQQLIHTKYFDTFNFYFAKPINEILANVQIDHVILFKDLLFYNDDNEYLKRYYKVDEVEPRMQILSEFYTNQYKETRPNVCIINQRSIIHKRNQKQAKIYLSKFQKTEPAQQQVYVGKKMLPDRMFSLDCSVSPTENSESMQPKLQISWDSKSHNIYDLTQSLLKKKQLQDGINLHALILLNNRDSIKLFLKEHDSDFVDALDGLNQMATQMIKKQAQLLSSSSDLKVVESVTHIFNKQKLQPQSSEAEFLSNFATNDPYASERSHVEYKSPKLLKAAKVPPLNTVPLRQQHEKQQVATTRKRDPNYLKTIFLSKGGKQPQPTTDNRISHQVLKKVYQQHIDKILIKPKKQLIIIKSEHSQSPDKRKVLKQRDSQSSETSTSNMKNHQKIQSQFNKFQDFRSSSSKHKVYLKQTANNPALLKKANFSQLTRTSPSTTQLFRKRAHYNQTSTINNSFHQTSNKNLSKHQEYSKIDRPTKKPSCSPSILLRSLSSNPSMTQSPARRIEIKVNLNKLIQQQDEEQQAEGYWTQRGVQAEIDDTTLKGNQTERNAYKFFQKVAPIILLCDQKTLNQLYVKLSPSQQKILKQKLKTPIGKNVVQKKVM